MPNLTDLVKAVENFGASGLIVWFMWRLTDKWAALFLAAQERQTNAMISQAGAITSMAETVKAGQTDQREILLDSGH